MNQIVKVTGQGTHRSWVIGLNCPTHWSPGQEETITNGLYWRPLNCRYLLTRLLLSRPCACSMYFVMMAFEKLSRPRPPKSRPIKICIAVFSINLASDSAVIAFQHLRGHKDAHKHKVVLIISLGTNKLKLCKRWCLMNQLSGKQV